MEGKNNCRSAFSDMHPLVGFVYFAVMLIFGMTMLHPVMLSVTVLSALTLYARLRGIRAMVRFTGFLALVITVSAIINPVFNHRGVTILFYGLGSNPITLEAVVYGFVSGFMLAGALAVFAVLSVVMTEDKIVFLFGRVTPSFALLISMTLRFAAVMKERTVQTFSAQKCFYRDERILGKLRLSFAVISAVIGHIIESSLDAANSMKARGYGLRGRTACRIYGFTRRDAMAIFAMLLFLGTALLGLLSGGARASYYPYIKLSLAENASFAVYIGYALFGFLPTIINFTEDVKWKCIELKI